MSGNRMILMMLLAAALAIQVNAQAPSGPKDISTVVAGCRKIDGFIPLYWNESSGKLYMQVDRFDQEFLYQVSLPAGVGSNEIGLDRGQLGDTYVVYFERIGPKVLLVSPNYRYRALGAGPAEREAVQDSFAQSVIWGFKVEAEHGGAVLVDATGFLLRDAHGAADRLKAAGQGSFRLDESRSAFYLPRTKGFPYNSEVETVLTFASDDPGPLLADVAPDPKSVSVREHFSFVQLPDDDYKPRVFDPRVGIFGLEFYDFSSPISDPIERRWIIRHRLQKRDPGAAVSEPVKPLVYYVDNGAPPLIREALIEGASWWKEAFEAAGFKDAFEVKVLPAGADPMDIRYNVIYWVDRQTRGWSYGSYVADPRTGEIIKADVTLGSLRVRQDYTIGSGLIPQTSKAKGYRGATGMPGDGCDFGTALDIDYLAALDPSSDVEQMALARVRQLAAHEVGHTLGLAHNFAASTYGQASVMDYPAPMVQIRDGKLDISKAYAVGIGAYDKFAIRYAYSEFPAGTDESGELNKLVDDGIAQGMLFITDEDARPAGAAHPLASLWDNGPDPIAMLRHEMEVRRIGLAGFGINSIRPGQPAFLLEAKLLPLYLHHRYQLAAAVKSLGGVYYTYAVREGSATSPAPVQEIVPGPRQREALNAVLETIDVGELRIPKPILDLIPPPAYGYLGPQIEVFENGTSPVFDPVAAARVAADMAISGLLERHRAARLIEFHARDASFPGFAEVLRALVAKTWKAPEPRDAYGGEIQQAVQSLVVRRLMALAEDPQASGEIRAASSATLKDLAIFLRSPKSIGIPPAQRGGSIDDIERFLKRPDEVSKPQAPVRIPPGDPIGGRASQH